MSIHTDLISLILAPPRPIIQPMRSFGMVISCVCAFPGGVAAEGMCAAWGVWRGRPGKACAGTPATSSKQLLSNSNILSQAHWLAQAYAWANQWAWDRFVLHFSRSCFMSTQYPLCLMSTLSSTIWSVSWYGGQQELCRMPCQIDRPVLLHWIMSYNEDL